MPEIAVAPISVAIKAAAPAAAGAEVASGVAASAAEATAGATAGVTSELSSTGASLVGDADAAVEGMGSVAEGAGAGIPELAEPVRDQAGLEQRVGDVSDFVTTNEANAAGDGSAEAPSGEVVDQPNAVPGEEAPTDSAAEPSGASTQEAADQTPPPAETPTAEASAQRMQELKDKVKDASATEDEFAELNRLNFQDKKNEQNQRLRDKMLSGEPLTSHELWLLSNSPASPDDLEAQLPAPRMEGTVAPEGTEQPEVAILRTQVEGLSRQVAELQAFINILKPTLETLLAKQVAEEKDPEKKTMWQMMLNIIKALVLSAVIETTGTVKGSVADQAK